MTAAPGLRRPLGSYIVWMFIGALALVALAALDWDLTALASAEERALAWQRLSSFLSAFGAPDLSRPALENAFSLAGQTLSMALLGTLLGAVMAYPLALGAARSVVLGDARPTAKSVSALRRALLELLEGLCELLGHLLQPGNRDQQGCRRLGHQPRFANRGLAHLDQFNPRDAVAYGD